MVDPNHVHLTMDHPDLIHHDYKQYEAHAEHDYEYIKMIEEHMESIGRVWSHHAGDPEETQYELWTWAKARVGEIILSPSRCPLVSNQSADRAQPRNLYLKFITILTLNKLIKIIF